MKTASVLAAVAGLGLASAALAGPITLNVGAMSLLPGAPFVSNFTVTENIDVLGFTFAGLNTLLGGLSWAADTRLFITAPNLSSASIGGYENLGLSTFEWDFQGESSSESGPYASGPHNFAFGNSVGEWTLTFVNDWEDDDSRIDWSGVTVELTDTYAPAAVPEPSSLALLFGLGPIGMLVAGRRKRKQQTPAV